MSEPATTTDVVVEPETPVTPNIIFADIGLLALEYFLVKWLIKKWNEFKSNEGPPVRRCSDKVQVPAWPTLQKPLNPNVPQFVFYLDYQNVCLILNEQYNREGYNGNAIFRIQADAANFNTQWQGWNWHVEVRMGKGANGGSVDTDKTWLWYYQCPAKRWKYDSNKIAYNPDDTPYNNYLCGCCDQTCNEYGQFNKCNYGTISINGQGIFYLFYQLWYQQQQNGNVPEPAKCTS
jgi:hypothetical protein